MATQPRWYSKKEAAEFLNTSVHQLEMYLEAYEISFRPAGNAKPNQGPLFYEGWLLKWLEENVSGLKK